jgi:phosphoglycerate dehydrogenase-like enzyme
MRVLIAYPHHEALAAWILARRPDLELRGRVPGEVTTADLEWAETMVGFKRPPVPGWGNLRWIHSIGAGVDAFLFRTDLPDAVLVTRSSEDFGPQIGEYCVARALAVTQQLDALAASQVAGRWQPIVPRTFAGTRAVIAGTGMVGRGIAHRFTALGAAVDGVSRSGRPTAPFRTVFPIEAFAAAMEGADWLVLALPLTEDTFHLFDRQRLSMCAGAYLINIGRGAVADEASLPTAIDRGWLSGAALDVFEREPLPADSPLWRHPRVTVSPHCSGLTTTAGAGEGFLECLTAVEKGERPRWKVERGEGY